MKNFKVFLNDDLIGTTLVSPEATIKQLKDYGISIAKHYKTEAIERYVTDIFPSPDNKLDLDQISDNTSLKPYWTSFTDPSLVIYPLHGNREMEYGYETLPVDIKKYVIDKLEPREALELCKTVKCDWKHLLNLNYDFVTQGFAPKNFNDEEKFRYLSTRISKNVNTSKEPEIIFVHLNGTPLGKRTYFNIKDDPYLDNEEKLIEIEERKKNMQAILDTLRESKAIDWVNQDNFNMWIKVNDKDFLPRNVRMYDDDLLMNVYVFNEDNGLDDFYDYPDERIKYVDKNIEYPGKVDITFDVIRNTIVKIMKQADNHTFSIDEINHEYVDLIISFNFNTHDVTHEYIVWAMMNHGFTRSEAEVIATTNIRTEYKDFVENLKRLYGFDVTKEFQ